MRSPAFPSHGRESAGRMDENSRCCLLMRLGDWDQRVRRIGLTSDRAVVQSGIANRARVGMTTHYVVNSRVIDT